MKQAVWFPTEEYKEKTRLYGWMKSLGYEDYEIFYNKSIEETAWFWGEACHIEKMTQYERRLRLPVSSANRQRQK